MSNSSASPNASLGHTRGVLRSSLGVMRKVLLHRATISVVVVFVIVGLLIVFAWLLARPNGELYFASFPAVAGDTKKNELATDLFERADATVEHAADLYKILPQAVEYPEHAVPIPPSTPPSATGIRQLIHSFVLSTIIEKENTKFSIQFDLLAMLEESYAYFGYQNYYVVVKSLDASDKCKPKAVGDCWEIVAKYWPSLLRPEIFVGTKDELAQDLSVLILRGALRNEGDVWQNAAAAEDPPPFIMAAETPSTMQSLESTATGIQMLKLGLAHPNCQDKSEDGCVDAARKLFEQTPSPVAAFGQALIEIDAALRAARRLEPDLEVESHLHVVPRIGRTGHCRANSCGRQSSSTDQGSSSTCSISVGWRRTFSWWDCLGASLARWPTIGALTGKVASARWGKRMTFRRLCSPMLKPPGSTRR